MTSTPWFSSISPSSSQYLPSSATVFAINFRHVSEVTCEKAEGKLLRNFRRVKSQFLGGQVGWKSFDKRNLKSSIKFFWLTAECVRFKYLLFSSFELRFLGFWYFIRYKMIVLLGNVSAEGEGLNIVFLMLIQDCR